MNEPTLSVIEAELSGRLVGQMFGKIFVLARNRIAIDFRLTDGTYLFICVDPNSPRIYLINRRLKTIEKQSGTPLPFYVQLRKYLAHSTLLKIKKLKSERVLKFDLSGTDELGEKAEYSLIIQLTGRSSNLFLLDRDSRILESLKSTEGIGQTPESIYSPPLRADTGAHEDRSVFPSGDSGSISEALDEYYLRKESEERLRSRSNSARAILKKEITKKTRLRKSLERDLENHGDPLRWKHFGEVLLANVSTARRVEDKIIVIDYFAPDTPELEIAAKENQTVTDAAESYFKRYSKARNAEIEVTERIRIIKNELLQLEDRKQILDEAIENGNEEVIDSFLGGNKKRGSKKLTKIRNDDSFPGTKRYTSSDGFEILVGKRSKDNDFLTFRIAKSLDTWLHAADYPGSHVVIRNPNRKEIPPSTLVEAAAIAAFFSKAKKEAKAAVHYTQKKFVNKPKGAAAGLVSLASFKTILVKPKIPDK